MFFLLGLSLVKYDYDICYLAWVQVGERYMNYYAKVIS